MSECEFCKALETYKLGAKYFDESLLPEQKEKLGKRMNDYSVAIVEWSWWKKRGRKSAGRTVGYRRNGVGYKLNFCPECGKDLRRRKRERDLQELREVQADV